jgi:hypothetical protein
MSYTHPHRSSGISFHLAAACHLELVRWLRENRKLGWEDPSNSLDRAYFWFFQREWVSLPPYFGRKSSWHELATWLPALTEAVAAESDPLILDELAYWFWSGSLPSRVSPEVAGWRQQLIATWEKKWRENPPRGTDLKNTIANIIPLRALVSLDPRGSRLEEWLAVAEETMGKRVMKQSDMVRLGALAGWRPNIHSPPDSSVLKKWMEFWKNCLQGEVDPDLQVVAFHALLNAMEIRDRKTDRELEVLLTGLAKAIMALPPSRTYGHEEQGKQSYLRTLPWLWSFPYHCPPHWLRMAPACLEPLSQVISAWLQQTVSTRHEALRRGAWDMLSVWDRLGIITACGIDIAPHILQARHTEHKTHSWWVLTALTRWVPPPSAAGSLNLWLDGWKAMSVSSRSCESNIGLRGRFHLLLAGQLTQHEEETLIADYLQSAASETAATSFLLSTSALVKGVKLPALMERWSDIGKKCPHPMEAAMWDTLRYRLLLEQWLCAVQSFGIHADGTTVLRSLRLLRQCCWRDEDAGLWERMQMVANEVAVRFSPRRLRLINGKVEFSDRSHPSYHWNQKTTMTGTMTETTETALSFASGQGSCQGRI